MVCTLVTREDLTSTDVGKDDYGDDGVVSLQLCAAGEKILLFKKLFIARFYYASVRCGLFTNLLWFHSRERPTVRPALRHRE